MEHQPVQPEITPVVLRARRDGWTAERQRIFLTALAETGCISDACKTAGVTPRSAHRLRGRADAESFANAWDDALLLAVPRLAALAFERATRGAIRELWKGGELVAETRAPSDKLLMFLLQHLRAEWFRPKTSSSTSATRGAWGRFHKAVGGLADNEETADPLTERDYRATPPDQLPDPLPELDEEP